MATNIAGNGGATAVVEAPPSDTISWKAQNCHVGAIEKQLTHLWGHEAGTSGEGANHPVSRTRVLNLVAVTSSSDGAARIKELVSHMSGQHPSRTIILVCHPEQADSGGVDAEVEAHRLKTGRVSGDVSWEVVTVNARGRTAFHLASLVNPLLITDLPTFLWWSGEPPFESELFTRLLEISDRTMVDSLSFRPPFEKDVPRLARMVKKWGNKVAFSDFNWARIRPWVEFTIQMFDGAQFRPYLSGITKVSVQFEAPCEDPNPNPAQGLLYTSWLASRLKWKPDKGRKRLSQGGFALTYAMPGHTDVQALVEIVAKDTRRCGSGEISALAIEATWLGKKAVFEVVRSSDQAHATITKSIDGAPPVGKVVEFEKTTDNSVLALELGIFDRDMAYEGAVDMAASVLGSKAKDKGGS